MLVLSRRIGEAIVVGADIQLTVVKLTGGRVTLGIDAPASIPVRRLEVPDICESEMKPCRTELNADPVATGSFN